MKMLRQQVARFDPANRSLRFRGLKETEVGARCKTIEGIVTSLGVEKPFVVDHIYKGPAGQRILSDMSIVICPCTAQREFALKEYEKAPANFKGSIVNDIKIDRAKPQHQINRNNALRKASDLLKKTPGNADKGEFA